MLKKGIIMSLSPSYAVVMEKGGLFHQIKLKEAMSIGQAILFTDEDIVIHTPTLSHHLRPIMALAAALILFLIPTLYAVQLPYAVVSLDVNPSIELLLDKKGTVKKIIAKNEDGVALELDSLKGHNLEIALSQLSEELTLHDFMTDSPYVLVSYADLKNNSLELNMLLHSYMEAIFKDSRIVYLPSDKQSYKHANKEHLSLGRYSASQMLSEQFPDVNFETIDIPSLIHYLEPDEDLDDLLEDLLDELPHSKPASSSNVSNTQIPNDNTHNKSEDHLNGNNTGHLGTVSGNKNPADDNHNSNESDDDDNNHDSNEPDDNDDNHDSNEPDNDDDNHDSNESNDDDDDDSNEPDDNDDDDDSNESDDNDDNHNSNESNDDDDNHNSNESDDDDDDDSNESDDDDDDDSNESDEDDDNN